MREEHKKNGIIHKIVETGSEISGGVGGAVIGGLVAGPLGSIIGGASGPLLTMVFNTIGMEIKDRLLSKREITRIGAAYAFAIDKINENVQKGVLIANMLISC